MAGLATEVAREAVVGVLMVVTLVVEVLMVVASVGVTTVDRDGARWEEAETMG